MISNVAQHKSKNGVLAPYWDSALIEKSASGSVASFADGADGIPMVSVVADIDAVQDLHGQSGPYPSGGGKNLIPYPYSSEDGTRSGITFTTDSDGKFTASGETTGGTNFYLINGGSLKADTYTLSIKGNHTGMVLYLRNATASATVVSISGGTTDAEVSFTISEDIENFSLYFNQGSTERTIAISAYIQLEVGSTATAYAPYSNICPISGWDEVNVTRTGKNLLDADTVYADFKVAENVFMGISTGIASKIFYIPSSMVGKQLTFSAFIDLVGVSLPNSYLTQAGVENSRINGNAIRAGESGYSSVTFIPQSTSDYIRFTWGSGSWTVTIKDIQLEVGSTVSDFEPYIAQTYPTTLPQTVYGGTIDVVSGVLTVTHGILNLASVSWATTSWSGYRYDIPDALGVANPSLVSDIMSDTYKVSSYTTVQGGTANTICLGGSSANRNRVYVKADSTPSGTLVYPLATPQTIQLTPTEVDSLLADNNVWADSGNISVVYRADSTLAYNQLTNAIVSLGGNI